MTAIVAQRDHFGFGRVLGDAFKTFGRNLKAFIPIGLLLAVPPGVLINMGSAGLSTASVAFTLSTAGAGLILSNVCGALLQAAVTLILARELNEEPPSPWRDLVRAGRKVLPLAGVSAVCLLAYASFLLAVFLPTYSAYMIGGRGSAFGALVMLVTVFGGLPLLMWFVVSISVAIPSLVTERLGVLAALKRSFRLTRGYRWPIIGVMSVIGVAMLVFQLLVRVVAMMVAVAAQADKGSNEIIVDLIVAPISGPLFASAITLAFFELRRIKQGVGGQPLATVFD